eukprot:1117839-Pelagomonas_calceolata.AAC.1
MKKSKVSTLASQTISLSELVLCRMAIGDPGREAFMAPPQGKTLSNISALPSSTLLIGGIKHVIPASRTTNKNRPYQQDVNLLSALDVTTKVCCGESVLQMPDAGGTRLPAFRVRVEWGKRECRRADERYNRILHLRH